MNDSQELIVGLRRCGRKFLDSTIPLLTKQRNEAKVDLYDPVADEVMGGLFARVFRLLQVFVLDYHIWAEDLASVVLRMMLESVFYMRFLSKQNRPELFLAFQRYGIGQEKLFKLQLRKLLEEESINDSSDLQEFIDSDSDEEIADELVKISLKNFEDLRKLATDAGMKTEYVLYYQSDSVTVHGHWPALRSYSLQTCDEPLHRLHLQPTFDLPSLNPNFLRRAFRLFMDAYELWIGRYGLQDVVTPVVEQYFESFIAAGADEEASDTGGPGEQPQEK